MVVLLKMLVIPSDIIDLDYFVKLIIFILLTTTLILWSLPPPQKKMNSLSWWLNMNSKRFLEVLQSKSGVQALSIVFLASWVVDIYLFLINYSIKKFPF